MRDECDRQTTIGGGIFGAPANLSVPDSVAQRTPLSRQQQPQCKPQRLGLPTRLQKPAPGTLRLRCLMRGGAKPAGKELQQGVKKKAGWMCERAAESAPRWRRLCGDRHKQQDSSTHSVGMREASASSRCSVKPKLPCRCSSLRPVRRSSMAGMRPVSSFTCSASVSRRGSAA